MKITYILPFWRILAGKDSDGMDVNQSLNSGCALSASIASHICSNIGIHDIRADMRGYGSG